MPTNLPRVLAVSACLSLACASNALGSDDACSPGEADKAATSTDECVELEPVTIFGPARSPRDVAGGASVVTSEELQAFDTTDIVRALRRVPGISLQIEDGWALRPNISIRGTATERSSRVTLLEDNVLIAPAPYSAASAYYFPTFGRISSVEVLKGPASITQGPYTVGGAVNLISTPIPTTRQGQLHGGMGSDATWRLHGWYGDSTERFGYVLETHQWESDGYQAIDRSDRKTGLEKEDYLAKLAFYSDPSAPVYQSLQLKFQTSDETSQQSYLGLTDTDFASDALGRYGVSALDEMNNDHDQVSLTWRLETESGLGTTVTAYSNDTTRAWYKTEGMDFDGSESPDDFSQTSWSNIVSAINNGQGLAGFTAEELEGILHGADTAPGSIQLRNNARTYESRGIQVAVDHMLTAGTIVHRLEAGLRYHEDEEDRLQRNDSYQQLAGQLVLNARGLEGNAGNRIQSAEAWAFYVFDRIETASWTFTPGLRYESIDLTRVRYDESSDDPSSRDPSNFRDTRSNEVDIWLPGMGALYRLNDDWKLVAGVHKGFAVPGNEPGVDPEESINYELGVRFEDGRNSFEALAFYNDYSNLVGVCTNASGSDCEPGDSFNGDAARIPGLELSWRHYAEFDNGWAIPVQLAYTWMNAEFQTSFDSEFFGDVQPGDPVPYVPENQLWFAIGLEKDRWSADLSVNLLDEVCTSAQCGSFERTEAATLVDLALNYRFSESLEFFGVVENLTDELYIAGRQPYGARPNKPQTYVLGARFSF